jgi:hypothetical protein
MRQNVGFDFFLPSARLDPNLLVHRVPKSQVIIRRPAQLKGHPRAHISEDIADDSKQASTSTSPSLPSAALPSSNVQGIVEEHPDELSQIRHLLRPPPIPGMDDWGIPPESTEPCDPAIKVRYSYNFSSRSLYSFFSIRPNLPNSILLNETPATRNISTIRLCLIGRSETLIYTLNWWSLSMLMNGRLIFQKTFGIRMM